MATMTTTNSVKDTAGSPLGPGTAEAWLPTEAGDLVVQPVQRESIAIQAVGSVSATGGTSRYSVPIVSADPATAWTAEGEEIGVSEAAFQEVGDVFHKLAGITVVSNEMIYDSGHDVALTVTDGLGRDLAKKLDAAFFGTRGGNDRQPVGLADVEGVNTIQVTGGAWKDVDPFTDAIYAADAEGVTLAAFVANPADALALAKLKDEDGSNRPLLELDPSRPGGQVVRGVPMLTSPAVTAGTVWGLPGAGRVVIAMHKDVEVDNSKDAYWARDVLGIRATMRLTFLYPHPAAIQKLTLGA